MTPLAKVLLYTLLAVVTLAVPAFFWHQSAVATFLLLIASVIMLTIERDEKLLVLYVAIFVAGPLAEAVLIAFGAWSYANSSVLGFPIWLPFVWGNAALYIVGLKQYIDSLYGRT